MRRYFSTDGWDIAWTLIRGVFSSVAQMAIVPMQDLLSLGSEGRMNYPGRARGNWAWRYRREMLTEHILWRLSEMTATYGREREKKAAEPDPVYEEAVKAAAKAADK